jgi:hypothetical protein
VNDHAENRPLDPEPGAWIFPASLALGLVAPALFLFQSDLASPNPSFTIGLVIFGWLLAAALIYAVLRFAELMRNRSWRRANLAILQLPVRERILLISRVVVIGAVFFAVSVPLRALTEGFDEASVWYHGVFSTIFFTAGFLGNAVLNGNLNPFGIKKVSVDGKQGL